MSSKEEEFREHDNLGKKIKIWKNRDGEENQVLGNYINPCLGRIGRPCHKQLLPKLLRCLEKSEEITEDMLKGDAYQKDETDITTI